MNKEQFIRLFINKEVYFQDFKDAVMEFTNCTEQQFKKFIEYIKLCEQLPEALIPNHISYSKCISIMHPYFEKKLEITYLFTKHEKLIL